MTNNQYTQSEVDKFNDMAHEWWSLDGAFRTLHQINPTRVKFIQKHVALNNKHVLDVGCGGGILAEALASENALVDAIDLAPSSIEIAKLHLYESNLNVNYECIEVGEKAIQCPEKYDVVTCMEMLEHVPSPEYIIEQISKLVKPNGMVFLSTLNRNYKSYALGVLAAEHILKLVPKGTHEYSKFIKPAELSQILRNHNLEVIDIKGINYNPFTKNFDLTHKTDVNYLIACKKTC